MATYVENGFVKDSSSRALVVQGLNDRDNGQAGIYGHTGPGALGTTGPVANRAYMTRFVPSRAITVRSIAFNVGNPASNDDAIDVGIYDSTGTRLVSLGATTGLANSVGVKIVTIPAVALSAGTVYYAAFSYGTIGGTAAVVGAVLFSHIGAGGLFCPTSTAELPTVECDAKDASHPLPAAWGALGRATSQNVLLALRES